MTSRPDVHSPHVRMLQRQRFASYRLTGCAGPGKGLGSVSRRGAAPRFLPRLREYTKCMHVMPESQDRRCGVGWPWSRYPWCVAWALQGGLFNRVVGHGPDVHRLRWRARQVTARAIMVSMRCSPRSHFEMDARCLNPNALAISSWVQPSRRRSLRSSRPVTTWGG
jgi:hypothetical protein